MKGWILIGKASWDTYEYRRFLEEAEEQRIEAVLYDPKEFDIELTTNGRDSLFCVRQPVQLPDFVLPRTGSGTGYYDFAVFRHIESIGVPLINSSNAIEKARDKLHTIELLVYNRLPTPKTMLARFPVDLEFIAEKFQFPLVVKSIVGSKGKGVCLCESQDQMDDLMQMLELSKKENVNYIIQEFVSSSRGEDIRVIVVGGKAIGAMRRRARDGQFKANISIGGSGEALELDSDLEWLSIQAAGVLGLDIAGVDLLFDREGYRICEVNAAPGFEGFEKATGINVPQQIYQYVQVRLSGLTGQIHAHTVPGLLRSIA